MEAYIPHVDEALPKIVVNGGDPDLPKNDSAVAGRPRANFNEILLKSKVDELLVGQPSRARPHLGLVLIPITTRLYDLMFDLRQYDSESLDSVRMGSVGSVESDLFGVGHDGLR